MDSQDHFIMEEESDMSSCAEENSRSRISERVKRDKSSSSDKSEVETETTQVVPLDKLTKGFKDSLKPLVKNMQVLSDTVNSLSSRAFARSRSITPSCSSSKRRRSSSSPEIMWKKRKEISSAEENEEDDEGWMTEDEIDVFEGEEITGKPVRKETKKYIETYFSKKLERESLEKKIE